MSDEIRIINPLTGGEKGSKLARFDLIPVNALYELARVYGKGAEKYAPRNWERGYEWGLSYAALHRHLVAFWGGEELDPETGLSHLAHAAWHCFTLFEFTKTQRALDTRQEKRVET